MLNPDGLHAQVLRGNAGTGKTVTAARLAQLFAAANRTVAPMRDGVKKGMKPQVLICASNDRSLDVIAGKRGAVLGTRPCVLSRTFMSDTKNEHKGKSIGTGH